MRTHDLGIWLFVGLDLWILSLNLKKLLEIGDPESGLLNAPKLRKYYTFSSLIITDLGQKQSGTSGFMLELSNTEIPASFGTSRASELHRLLLVLLSLNAMFGQ
jgi:hypothetical protein